MVFIDEHPRYGRIDDSPACCDGSTARSGPTSQATVRQLERARHEAMTTRLQTIRLVGSGTAAVGAERSAIQASGPPLGLVPKPTICVPSPLTPVAEDNFQPVRSSP